MRRFPIALPFLAALLGGTVLAAAPIQVEVVSATVNPDSHTTDVTLVNHSGKTALAWLGFRHWALA
jgi:hypothetical protein